MSDTWIVVADSSRARLFSAESTDGVLVEMKDLAHPQSRLHESELGSDQPGRSFDSGGEGRHAMGKGVEPHEQEAIQFAREIGGYLQQQQAGGAFAKLAIIAAPAFLGHLRAEIGDKLKSCLFAEVDKNLVQHDVAEIRQHLPAHLPR